MTDNTRTLMRHARQHNRAAMALLDDATDNVAGAGRPGHRHALVYEAKLKAAKLKREAQQAARTARRVARQSSRREADDGPT